MSAMAQLEMIPTRLACPSLSRVLARTVCDAETAEQDFAIGCADIEERLSTGSFYTPADVVEHFWDEYFQFNDITTLSDLRDHLAQVTFIEPAVGAGIFLFALITKAVAYGCNSEDLAGIRFVGIDLNRSALEFIAAQIKIIEAACGRRFHHISLHEADFCQFRLVGGCKYSFVGNPP